MRSNGEMLTHHVANLSHKERRKEEEGRTMQRRRRAYLLVAHGLTRCHTSLAILSSDSFPLWRQKVQVEDPLPEALILHLHHLVGGGYGDAS